MYTKAAAFKPYLVRVSIPDLNIRKGPGTDYGKTGKYTRIGTFTIVEEADGKGASRWGLLKSYQKRRMAGYPLITQQECNWTAAADILCRRVYKAACKSPYDEEVAQING